MPQHHRIGHFLPEKAHRAPNGKWQRAKQKNADIRQQIEAEKAQVETFSKQASAARQDSKHYVTRTADLSKEIEKLEKEVQKTQQLAESLRFPNAALERKISDCDKLTKTKHLENANEESVAKQQQADQVSAQIS